MRVNEITIQFSSAKNQKRFEKMVGLDIVEHETFSKEEGYTSWTTFNIENWLFEDVANKILKTKKSLGLEEF